MNYGWKGLLLLFAVQNSLARTFYPVAITGYHRSRRRRSSSPVLHVSRKQKIEPKQTIESELTGKSDSYAELGPVGRIVAGAVEILVSTALEYLTAFSGGYLLGTVTDTPRLLFRSMNQPTLLKETSSRFVRLHSKSVKWAKTWGEISATFAGFDVLIKVVRCGKEDDWNSIISGAAAGAFFARKGT